MHYACEKDAGCGGLVTLSLLQYYKSPRGRFITRTTHANAPH